MNFLELKPEEVLELIKSGEIEVNEKDDNEWAPIYYFVDRQRIDLIKELIEMGADINSINNRYLKETPLHYATGICDCEITKFLIEKGADVNKKNINGDTPLHYAVSLMPVDVVELLLKYGANPNIQNEIGRTPLHVLLINFGFFIQFLDYDNIKEVLFDIVKLLIDAGADVTIKDKDGNIPLHYTVKYPYEDLGYIIHLLKSNK